MSKKKHKDQIRVNLDGETIAYCWRNGELGFTDGPLPEGALILDKGTGKEWRERIEIMCRLSYDGHTWLVPGIPEADDDIEALVAVRKFIAWISQRRERMKKAQGAA